MSISQVGSGGWSNGSVGLLMAGAAALGAGVSYLLWGSKSSSSSSSSRPSADLLPRMSPPPPGAHAVNFAASSSMPASSSRQPLLDRIQGLEQERSSLIEQLNGAKAQLEDARSGSDRLSQKFESLKVESSRLLKERDGRHSSLSSFARELEGQNIALTKELKQVRDELGRLNESFSKQNQELLATHAVALQGLHGTIGQLENDLVQTKAELAEVKKENQSLEQNGKADYASFRHYLSRTVELNEEVTKLEGLISNYKVKVEQLSKQNTVLIEREEMHLKTVNALSIANDSIGKLGDENRRLQFEYDQMYADYSQNRADRNKLIAFARELETLRSDISQLSAVNAKFKEEKADLIETHKKEMYVLQRENAHLKSAVVELEDDKQTLMTEGAAAIGQLQEQLNALTEENRELRETVSAPTGTE